MGKETLVIALGGNAIVGESRTFDSQFEAVTLATKEIAGLIRRGVRVVITHGNGPQVGDTLLRHESASDLVPPLPLYACVAETQGLLGFMIQASLSRNLSLHTSISSLISIVRVSRNDLAFMTPSKPIGPVFRKGELDKVREMNPHHTFAVIAPDRYRRVVASPDPISIDNVKSVRDLLEKGNVVITAGGGGIPAIRHGSQTTFVDAVVDKDLSSERLATSIRASKLVILTDVDGAYLDYNTDNKKLLRNVAAKEMKRYLRLGEFGEGSMAPKVKAAVRFAENTGNRAIICHLTKLKEALAGKSGTLVHY